ncbi:MAG: LysM peptidoglycan-binding domain-containing protein [Lachnospiraceae bacterium]|nr:LysM peptidoglycan-binding domain-containing protein [Lachnospiraceae bacterium]
MRKRTKTLFRRVSALLLAGLVLTSTAAPVRAAGTSNAAGLSVAYHTQEEILARMKSDGLSLSDPFTYGEAPVTEGNYAPGSLSQDTLDKALKMLNQVRYIAGLSDNVTLSDEYNQKTQAASLVMFLNNELNHYPDKPEVFGSEYEQLYQLGKEGARSSNIAMAASTNTISGAVSLHDTIVNGWMADADGSNIEKVGHRRWILNPAMKATGFGAIFGAIAVNGNSYGYTYSAMYSLDGAGAGGECSVAWPAQNMPVAYFDATYPWSISTGVEENPATVKVTLTRVSDGKVWNFSAAGADGDFYVQNSTNSSIVGQMGACIIFRPKDIEAYKAGDSFQVSIEGISAPISYTVNFFDENSVGTTPGTTTPPTGGDQPGTTTPPTGGDQPGTTTPPSSGNQPGTTTPPSSGNQPGTTTPPASSSQPSGTQSGVSQAPVIVNVDWNSVNNSISTAPAAGNDQNVNATVGSQFEVPADVLNNLAGKDTTLFLHTGSGIAFGLSGSDVKTGDASFKVTMTSGDVPEEAKQQVLTGAYASRSFGMSEKGDYSIPVSVHMNLGKENAGKQAFLYSYDEEAGTMKLVGTFTVTEQGQAMFGISRGDEYIAVVADKAVEGIGNASQGSGRTYTVKNGDTLFGIARRNGVNVNTLIQANPQIRNINNIHPGWIINIR